MKITIEITENDYERFKRCMVLTERDDDDEEEFKYTMFAASIENCLAEYGE